jgi:UDP-N-acetylmuramate: L-alanyl-gamma-D-glutamyl-meso-diaminopimelate ligase
MAKEKIHILGICGTFMGGLAILGKEAGLEISGCDSNIYPPMSEHLSEMGIDIIPGYDPSDLPKADFYVIGNAISRGNSALEELLNRKANLFSGPQWLYNFILKNKKVIAASGTHGKTTTTAMIAWIFEYSKIDVGYLIAGKPKDFKKSARKGSEDIFVIEADEYDTAFFDKRSKFIHYKPDTLIVNNIEFDHADIFKDISAIHREFHNLIRSMPEKAEIIFPTDDLNIAKVLDMGCWSQQISYAFGDKSQNTYSPILPDYSKIKFKIGKEEGELKWQMLGDHNARNAMSAILATKKYGISLNQSLEALSNFNGVSKRQDILLENENIILMEDFAHHPTAIEMTLTSLKQKYKDHKIIAAIELRSNTMKSGYHDDVLVGATKGADVVFWKSENKTQLDKLIKLDSDRSRLINSVEETSKEIIKSIEKDTLIVVMSNADFDGFSQKIIDRLKDG